LPQYTARIRPWQGILLKKSFQNINKHIAKVAQLAEHDLAPIYGTNPTLARDFIEKEFSNQQQT
jgi:hypothetical protein